MEKRKLDFVYWLNHLFFTIGVLFVSTLIHEIFHFIDCGGEFTAGFYFLDGKAGFGTTFCERDLRYGEVIPHLISVAFIVLVGYIKIKRDFQKAK